MSHIVVSGANGFVGRALCKLALDRGHRVTALVRRPGGCVEGVREWVHVPADFDGLDTALPADLQADCVVHLAARVHVMHDDAADPQAVFDATNVGGTLRLARAARAHGVSRFVFASSVKAIAEVDEGVPLSEDVPPCPQDPYGISKLKAERALAELRETNGLDVVIVRPPLVYGPCVRANFLQMMNAVSRRVPLPLGAVGARRSIVFVENLADALLRCALDPLAANGCFHVADDDPLSVCTMLREIGRALGKRAVLVPVPVAALRVLGALAGRANQVDRLTRSLQLDTSRLKAELAWEPPYTTEQGLERTATWFNTRHHDK